MWNSRGSLNGTVWERKLENKRGGEKERIEGGGESGKIRDVMAE